MTTHKLPRRQVRWALTLSSYDFRIVYQKGALNPADGLSRRPDHQYEAEQEESEENASQLQRILFPTVALLSVEPRDDVLTHEMLLREVLVAGTTSSRQQNQRTQARTAASEEALYEEIDVSLIEILPEFLRIDPLAKHMLEKITAREEHPELPDPHPL